MAENMDKPGKVVALRRATPLSKMRDALVRLSDSSLMMAYIQENAPHEIALLRFTNVKLDLSYDTIRKYFVLYLCATPQVPGMPMVFCGTCAKSLMVAGLERLCTLKERKEGLSIPIEGVKPKYVPQMDLFSK
ncbi:hypothetical protein [Geoalkalibacter halelectricus]|uniref:hypothetical protein n=1 Tax=Geoalkalibacter halelectricus TaxID=2847045 RepID=UPI003D1A6CFF